MVKIRVIKSHLVLAVFKWIETLRVRGVLPTVLIYTLTLSSFFTYSLKEGLVLTLVASLVVCFCVIIKIDRLPFLNTKIVVVTASCFYLLISFFNFRYLSGDGLLLYLKNTYLLTDKWSLTGLGDYLYPYLIELLLGKLLKYSSLYMVNLTFGIVSLSALYTSYLLLKELVQDSKAIKWSLLILCFSPTFLAFAFYDFKIENFLLTCSNLCLLFLIRCTKQRKTKYYVLGGFCGALAVLTKLSYLPFFVVFYICFALWMIRSKQKTFHLCVLSAVCFLLPLFVWDTLYGLNVPHLFADRVGILTANSKLNFSNDFNLNKNTQRQCKQEMVSHAYGHYYYGNIITQPFYYFFRINRDRNEVTLFPSDKANPGIFMYIGFFLMPTLLFSKRFKFLVAREIWLIPAVIISLLFYLSIKGVYWYIYPLYPFMALAFVLYFKQLFRLFSFVFLFATVFSYYLIYSTVPYLLSIDPAAALEQTKLKKALDIKTGAFDKIKPGEYALYAFTREDNLIVPITFVTNSDEKVVEVPYYFASSTSQSLGEMAAELVDHDVKYVVAAFDYLPQEKVFGSCLKANKEKLYDFIKYKTEETQSPILFKIIE